MIKNPFNPKNIFWYKIFKPFVDMLNKMQDSSDKSGIDVETDKTTIKKGNDVIELAENFIRIGVFQNPDDQTINIGVEIDKTQGSVTVVVGENNFSFDATSIGKLQDIMSKHDAIMAL